MSDTPHYTATVAIPARYESTRLPGKVMEMIGDLPIVHHVVNQVKKAKHVGEIIVVTDHQSVMDYCQKEDIRVLMTGNHASGTDRIASVLDHIKSDIVVNVQGDEPFIEPSYIDRLIQMLHDSGNDIATLSYKIKNLEPLFDPNVVKVVMDTTNKALYFSRQTIPACRNKPYAAWLESHDYHGHIGIYGFKKDVLRSVASLPMSQLEKVESLEQLRWLEHGYTISVVLVEGETISIDTPADLEKARLHWSKVGAVK